MSVCQWVPLRRGGGVTGITESKDRCLMEGGLERKVGVQHKQQTLRKTSKVEVYKTMQYMLLPFSL